MTDAQTEARAVAPDREHYNAADKIWRLSVVECKHAIATALAAKNAELDGAVFLKDAAEAALRKREVEINKLHAQLAEARKALASNASTFEAIRTHIDERSLPLARGLCSQGSFAARRALTGGKKDG